MKINLDTLNEKVKKIFEAVEKTVASIEDIVRGEIDADRNQQAPVRRVILAYSGAAAATSANPIPFSSFALLTPIHVAMVLHVGKRMGQEISVENAGEVFKEIMGAVGLSIAARVATGSLLKIGLPIIGGVLRTPVVFALTYGLGRVAEDYFQRKQDGLDFDVKAARRVFEEAVKEGRVEGAYADAVNKEEKKKTAAKKKTTTKKKPSGTAKKKPTGKKKNAKKK